MPISLPTALFAEIDEKNEKCAMSWNWMKKRTIFSTCRVQPKRDIGDRISKTAINSMSREIPRAVQAFKSFGFM